MAEDHKEQLAERLKQLGAKIDKHQTDLRDGSEDKPARSGFGQAMKLSTEFIVSIVLGATIGYGIDRLFGISPWGMVLFLLLGFCAGVLSMLRSAGLVAETDIHRARKLRKSANEDKV